MNAFRTLIQSESEIQPEKLKEILGFDSVEEAEENIRPVVPKCVKNLLKYCEVFTDDSHFSDLETLSYTFWS